MATVRDLITSSLRDLGALGVAEVATAAEAEDGLQVLNDMVGTWKTESLITYAMVQSEFTLVSNQEYYTIGTGADLNISRPIRIDAAYMKDSDGNYYAIYLAQSFQEYSDIVAKNVQATLIMVLYYDPSFPLGKVYVWPKAQDASYKLVLWTWQNLDEFSSLDEEISLPPGYNRAIRANLAIELSARYGRTVVPSLAKVAAESKSQLKRANLQMPILQMDARLTRQGQNFNYLTGEPY